MKKSIVMFIFFILLFYIQTVPAFAETISSVTAFIDSSKQVTVSGVINSGAGQMVNIRITDPKGNIEYLDSTVSRYQGNFIFSYTMTNNAAGKYDVTINASGVSAPVKTNFSYGIDNSLKALSISSGAFDSVFTPDNIQYTATVDNRVNSITVTPSASDSTASIKVNNMVVTSGNPSSSIILKEGANTINVAVTALNGSTKTYTITVSRQKSAGTSLTASASIDKSKQVTVSGTVSSGAGQLITLMITDPDKNVEFAGGTVSTSGGNYRLSYTMSNNVKGKYTAAVSALDLSQPVTTYFDYGTDAGLKNLSISSGGLSPSFSTDVTAYTASVGSSINSITVTPTANDSNAGIKINNTSVVSGSASGSVPLNAGANTINVVVTAQDGVTTKTYTITIKKDAPLPAGISVKAEINGQKLVTIGGTISAQGQQVSVMITDPKGNIEYLDSTESGVGGAFLFSYNMSNNTRGRYNVTVGALGLAFPAATYFIYDPGSADLRDLKISSGSLTPQFTPEIVQYSASVGYGTSSIKITPTAMDPDATINVNSIPVASGNTSSEISLGVGYNTITVIVTSQDSSVTKTYTISVTRSQPPMPPSLSGNAALGNLIISSGTLSPAFAAGTTSYAASVENNVSSVTVTPTVAESHATVKVNDTAVASGTASGAIALSVGDNPICIIVTAQDGATKTYTVTITRLEALSNDATLSNLTVMQISSDGYEINLTGLYTDSKGNYIAFNPGVTDYYINNANLGTHDFPGKIVPLVSDNKATVKVSVDAIDKPVNAGAYLFTLIADGNTHTIIIEVTAQDGTTKRAYKVYIKLPSIN